MKLFKPVIFRLALAVGVILFASIDVTAQGSNFVVVEGTLKAKESKEVLMFASVEVLDTAGSRIAVGLSDENGKFKLKIPRDKALDNLAGIKFSYVGYSAVLLEVSVDDDDRLRELDVYLQELDIIECWGPQPPPFFNPSYSSETFSQEDIKGVYRQ